MSAKTLQEKYNFLTFDVEDWFHVLDVPESTYSSGWDSLPSRVEMGVERFMEILSHYNISCTFFILGWIAERYPGIVSKIHASGHEIGSHGYGHELIHAVGVKRFRQDIRRCKSTLEDLIGAEVQGYRGPGFSITKRNLWAFDIIAEEGFRYDATLYPGTHGHGGIPRLPITPFTVTTLNELEIEEYPCTLFNLAGYRVAFSGGGYFRLFPHALISRTITRLNSQGIPVMTYLHPRDLDPDAPRLQMSWKRMFKCYVNVSKTHDKLNKIIQNHQFGSIRDWRNRNQKSLPHVDLREV